MKYFLYHGSEFLNYEDGKFSKSRGIGVFGSDAIETGIPADVFRFYLLYVRPETQDSMFNWSDFALKVNNELVNNLGNFINRHVKIMSFYMLHAYFIFRTLTFIKSNYSSDIPPVLLQDDDIKFIEEVNKHLQDYFEKMEKSKLRDGLKCILSISRLGNGYLQEGQPWKLIKSTTEKERFHWL